MEEKTMKKSVIAILLSLLMAMTLLGGCGGGSDPAVESEGGETVELTLGSWRADDVEQMNALLAEYKTVAPNVNITFQPTNPPDYNATLRVQLEGGTGPDLMYARSYAAGEELFNDGYFADVTDIPGLMDNFTPTNLSPWQTADGKMFAVPFAAVSSVVFYNKDIFAANNLSVPTTWADFIKVCDTLKAAGVTPLANGVAEEWDILECLTLGMVPNYIGGADERAKYESGEKSLADEAFVSLYTDVQSLSGYLPSGFEAINYNDSQALFATAQAAMFIDGSWSLGIYGDADFEWGTFAVPARDAADTAICFHPDMAITMNAATTHPDEARAFLEWLASPEGAATASKALPVGFFPMIDASIALEDPHGIEAFALNEGKVTDVRFLWPKFMDLYTPMNQEVIALLKGEQTPEGAAKAVETAAAPLIQ
jgi:raffinose/stachyose/melibiose transport system substrate-binding protein